VVQELAVRYRRDRPEVGSPAQIDIGAQMNRGARMRVAKDQCDFGDSVAELDRPHH
jgi:hypothetical protein